MEGKVPPVLLASLERPVAMIGNPKGTFFHFDNAAISTTALTIS